MLRRLPKPAILLPFAIFILLKIGIHTYMLHLGYQGYAQNWERWDSGLYLNIVQEGHTLFLSQHEH